MTGRVEFVCIGDFEHYFVDSEVDHVVPLGIDISEAMVPILIVSKLTESPIPMVSRPSVFTGWVVKVGSDTP